MDNYALLTSADRDAILHKKLYSAEAEHFALQTDIEIAQLSGSHELPDGTANPQFIEAVRQLGILQVQVDGLRDVIHRDDRAPTIDLDAAKD